MSYLFFQLDSASVPPDDGDQGPLDPPYGWRYWTPSPRSVVPPGVPLVPFAAWWAMHHLRLFANRDYGLCLIYTGDELVHRSGVFPRDPRFPFMARDDLQIGDTWTHPAHRNRGLAALAIRRIVALKRRPGRSFWYVVAADNGASVRAIQKAGFAMRGTGNKQQWPGLPRIGRYVLDG